MNSIRATRFQAGTIECHWRPHAKRTRANAAPIQVPHQGIRELWACSLRFGLSVEEQWLMTVQPPMHPVARDELGALRPEQRSQLTRYVDLLLQSSQLFNLTAIHDPALAWERHVLESLRLLPLLGAPGRLIDVGSGGGIPGLVLAIARPTIHVTLLEATSKKARFLEQTARALELGNVHVLCERAETAGAQGSHLRDSFDIAMARAVAPMRVLVELLAPFVKVGGLVLAVKGERAAVELSEAANALWSLHLQHESTLRQPTASVVLLRKQAGTPTKYPRRPGEPKRNPL
jgi:16S rRNA (guanine527-N7)-methyltransferase